MTKKRKERGSGRSREQQAFADLDSVRPDLTSFWNALMIKLRVYPTISRILERDDRFMELYSRSMRARTTRTKARAIEEFRDYIDSGEP